MNVENNSVIDNFGWPILSDHSERNDNFRFAFARYSINEVEPNVNRGSLTQPLNNNQKVRPDSVVDLM